MINKTIFIGIAGGSGSGKSTLAMNLCKKYKDQYSLIHLDDYFVKKDRVPELAGFKNWDCPEAIRFQDLHHDLLNLKDGLSITIRTKSELYNPAYIRSLDNRIDVTIHPTRVVIVEGYLVLVDETIRNLFDHKIFLDIPIEESLKRRSGNKFTPDRDYVEKVLMPMHEKYVDPSWLHANLILDSSIYGFETIQEYVEEYLLASKVIPI